MRGHEDHLETANEEAQRDEPEAAMRARLRQRRTDGLLWLSPTRKGLASRSETGGRGLVEIGGFIDVT